MKRTTVLGLIIAGIQLSALNTLNWMTPNVAYAGTDNTFFETTGYFIALGTVLGASTLPFYEQPGSNLMNLAYGAGIGAVTGLGFAIFGRSGKTSREGRIELDAAAEARGSAYADARGEYYPPVLSPMRTTTNLVQPVLVSAATVRPVQLWMPLVSLTW